MNSITVRSRGAHRDRVAQRRMTLLGIATILSLLVSLFPQVVGLPMPTASAHNLQTRMVYMFFDPATQACSTRAWRSSAGCDLRRTPLPAGGRRAGRHHQGGPARRHHHRRRRAHRLLRAQRRAGGRRRPTWCPTAAAASPRSAMKGQSPIAIGAGPIGAKATAQLIGLDAHARTRPTAITPRRRGPGHRPAPRHHRRRLRRHRHLLLHRPRHRPTAPGRPSPATSTANGCGSLAYQPHGATARR